MKTHRIPLFTLAAFGALLAQGQITLVGSANEDYVAVRSLVSNGPKLMRYISPGNGIELVNLDLTPFLTINYPPPPSGWAYKGPGDGGTGEGRAWYITESLFDADSTTIEVLVLMRLDNDYEAKGVRVIRQDGTVVFEDLDYSMGYNWDLYGGPSPLDDRSPIFHDHVGATFMLLTNEESSDSRLYQLPGSLPCLSCNGITVGMAEGGGGMEIVEMDLSPNPARDELNVRYVLPFRSQSLNLLITDGSGRTVQVVPLDRSGRSTIHLNALSSGSYQCSIRNGERVLMTKAFQVMR